MKQMGVTGSGQIFYLLMKHSDKFVPTMSMNQLHSLIIFKSDTSQNRVLIYQYDPYQGTEILKDSWSLKNGFLMGSQVPLHNQHQDLKGYELKVATPHDLDLYLFPYFYIVKDKNGDSFYGGTDIIMLKYVADRMNFRFSHHESIDRKWGGQTENGSWNGMIGMINRGVNINNHVYLKVGVLRASHKIFNSEVRICWNDASKFSSIS
jgi:hypothetical protein